MKIMDSIPDITDAKKNIRIKANKLDIIFNTTQLWSNIIAFMHNY